MTEVLDCVEQPPLVVRTSPVFEMDDDEFFQFCQINEGVRIERNSKGEMVFTAPAGGESSSSNVELVWQLANWAKTDKSGRVFDSCAGFVLPNKAIRSPDVSWAQNDRLAGLTEAQKQKFLPLCPDFVIELRSPSDSLASQKEKMEEYLANGARLGWLIDPLQKKVHVYRPDSAPEILINPVSVGGEDVLRKFVLELPPVWSPWA